MVSGMGKEARGHLAFNTAAVYCSARLSVLFISASETTKDPVSRRSILLLAMFCSSKICLLTQSSSPFEPVPLGNPFGISNPPRHV